MKVSVSLPDSDIEFLDRYAVVQGIASRSAALHKAIRLLRATELGVAYADAWAHWGDGDDSGAWETVTGDGLR